ncbi:MAG: hypothetical protein IJZ75_05335 [Clostridia bacterium]|nr:hypothetical protein [Clostridia bacterium]
MIKNEILSLVEKVHSLKKGKENSLPDNSYFLEEDTVLCYPRKFGDSRYPYRTDGLVMFTHSNGYIDCVDGMFNIFKCVHYNEDTNIAFFAGEEYNDGFYPISITGAARQLFENGVERYTVFTPFCTYYITETQKAIFAAKAYVDGNKHLRFSMGAVNRGEARKIYLCSYFEPTIRYTDSEGFYDRMQKFGEHFDCGGYVVKFRNRPVFDHLSANVSVTGDVEKRYFTTAKRTVLGRNGANITNALAFKNGFFDAQIDKTNTSDIPVISDMIHFNLEENGFAGIDYEMLVTATEEKAYGFIGTPIDSEKENEAIIKRKEADAKIFEKAKIEFNDWHNGDLHSEVINNFLKCVKRQVSFCALGDRYMGQFLGVRDVFQQLESALIWQPKEARSQIIRVLDCIMDNGRPPRQISFPSVSNPTPPLDINHYIDQGMWIIVTLHTYLAYTNDYSILDEVCGYFKASNGVGMARLPRSEVKDTVLEHLMKIIDYLVSNIDEETHCIHILRGDWNDALNELGRTRKEGKQFGNGVSIMATLQLYLGLNLMCEILNRVGKHTDVIEEYNKTRAIIKEGIEKYAIIRDENYPTRIIHGWGEDRSYFVGSFNDYDEKSRTSLTSHSYFAISGMINEFPELKENIVKNILSLDSKHGLRTFDEPFTSDSDKIGSLSRITPGTLENASAYIHASTFGVMALFLMGYPREAWRMLEKAMVISHDKPTRSTFVMPNSYFYSEEYNADGDSMSDWYTGSGTVLIKDIIKCGFGIEPTLSSLKIAPPEYFPCKTAKLTLEIKGCSVLVKYENRGEGERSIYLNGEKLTLKYDAVRNTYYAEIPERELTEKTEILITD